MDGVMRQYRRPRTERGGKSTFCPSGDWPSWAVAWRWKGGMGRGPDFILEVEENHHGTLRNSVQFGGMGMITASSQS